LYHRLEAGAALHPPWFDLTRVPLSSYMLPSLIFFPMLDRRGANLVGGTGGDDMAEPSESVLEHLVRSWERRGGEGVGQARSVED